jgi:hypothetical protein
MVRNTNVDPDDSSQFEEWKRKEEEKAKKKRELREMCQTLTEAGLCNVLRQQLTDYDWDSDIHPKGMDGAQRVDVVGKPKLRERFVFIEIERGGKAHAIDNAVKAWLYIEENTDSKPVLLVQIFSPYFYAKSGSKRRMKEAIFIGKQAEKATNYKLRYEPLGREYWPTSKESKVDTLKDKISALTADERNR